MKTIFIFLLTATLFISCNNTNSDTKKDEVTKDENNNTTETKDKKNNNPETKKGWSDSDKKQFYDDCVTRFTTNENPSMYCECCLPTAEAIFSSYNEMKKNMDPGKVHEYIRKTKKNCGDSGPE